MSDSVSSPEIIIAGPAEQGVIKPTIQQVLWYGVTPNCQLYRKSVVVLPKGEDTSYEFIPHGNQSLLELYNSAFTEAQENRIACVYIGPLNAMGFEDRQPAEIHNAVKEGVHIINDEIRPYITGYGGFLFGPSGGVLPEKLIK